MGYFKTSVNNGQLTLRNNPEERITHLHRGGSLKALLNIIISQSVGKFIRV